VTASQLRNLHIRSTSHSGQQCSSYCVLANLSELFEDLTSTCLEEVVIELWVNSSRKPAESLCCAKWPQVDKVLSNGRFAGLRRVSVIAQKAIDKSGTDRIKQEIPLLQAKRVLEVLF
jgi:hypothetical protein